jgi:hypothetical protein
MLVCRDYALNYGDYGKLLFGRPRKTPRGCLSKVEASPGSAAMHINRPVRSSRLADQDSYSVSDTRNRSCRTGRGNTSGGGSTLDDRANALANAINKTGVQSLGNPCTVAAFYGASAIGGTLTNGGVLTQGVEAATTYWPQALSQVSNWLYRQSLRGGPIANFILNIPKNYNKAKAAVLGGCNAMQ